MKAIEITKPYEIRLTVFTEKITDELPICFKIEVD